MILYFVETSQQRSRKGPSLLGDAAAAGLEPVTSVCDECRRDEEIERRAGESQEEPQGKRW